MAANSATPNQGAWGVNNQGAWEGLSGAEVAPPPPAVTTGRIFSKYW